MRVRDEHVKVECYMSPGLYQRLSENALTAEMSRAELIRQLVTEHLDNETGNDEQG